MQVIDYFVCFDTDQRVGTHPFDLLTECSDAVEIPFVVSEITRHDVRLIGACTAESAESQAGQYFNAVLIRQFKNSHFLHPPRNYRVYSITERKYSASRFPVRRGFRSREDRRQKSTAAGPIIHTPAPVKRVSGGIGPGLQLRILDWLCDASAAGLRTQALRRRGVNFLPSVDGSLDQSR